MFGEDIYIGGAKIGKRDHAVEGKAVEINGEKFYKISNFSEMDDFFMNIASNSDIWMFLSSNGALTAGRVNPNNALFPYYTDDRIHDLKGNTGSITSLLIEKNDKKYLWKPFTDNLSLYKIERNIYKNNIGNKVIFEEINHDLNISFQYSWMSSDKFGIIKNSKLTNNGSETINLTILDGIQNILPYGATRKFQLEYSTLLDGYKKNELLEKEGIGLYTLSSIPTDKAEPSESLRTTSVWSAGLKNSKVLLSGLQIKNFESGRKISQEVDVKGERGAYILDAEISLLPEDSKEWFIISDVNKDITDIKLLQAYINSDSDIIADIKNEIDKSAKKLKLKIAKSDGLQLTNDLRNVLRHSSNTLFNIMRGGLFEDGYNISKIDFIAFLKDANKLVVERNSEFINKLPDKFNLKELESLNKNNDSELIKLCMEYLPLSFSRRHGDPSRPWNHFSINLKDDNGNKILDYQGNWRDIFQNWEALAYSFPEYIENMIAKFLNASTADGYNPYRVTRDGFDWEELDPLDDWSFIGYWGDHQIIYLEKLLELSNNFHPSKIKFLLNQKRFAYANIPYRIKSYEDILKDPKDTIDFDYKLNEEITNRVEKYGTDEKFVYDKYGHILNVNMTEKILIPLLVKLSNFVPEAGIWMNTQRPEWNDANNALVGNGCSMVTVYYMRRYTLFLKNLFENIKNEKFTLTSEVAELLDEINKALSELNVMQNSEITDEQRKNIVDKLGIAGSNHRAKIYNDGFSGKSKDFSAEKIIDFCELTLNCLDNTIEKNRRDDNLYHTYNLISIENENKISIRRLYEMLEGQVAILSSGKLSVDESILLLKSLKKSKLFREDQFSYILYPNRTLKRFEDKNNISTSQIENSQVLQKWIKSKDERIIKIDNNGNIHFNSDFKNSRFLKEKLELISKNDSTFNGNDIKEILDIYEEVFNHISFTGRSGTMYKYEGLGSIYWHMVSKLLLAVNEIYKKAVDEKKNNNTVEIISELYYEIRKGIGSHKNPDEYGAFPSDAYSHTPIGKGVQQPGMTGQVKEDIISRIGEFGVNISEGKISFNKDSLLKVNEFLESQSSFEYYDVNNNLKTIPLNKNELAFTFCQIPIIYVRDNEAKIIVRFNDNKEEMIEGNELSDELSKSVFEREGKIERVIVKINK